MHNSYNQTISQKTKELIKSLLLGRLSITEIAKITGITEDTLQNYFNSEPEFISSTDALLELKEEIS